MQTNITSAPVIVSVSEVRDFERSSHERTTGAETMTGATASIHRGFSLIEILVVLLIIGITLGFALLAFGDFGEKRRMLTAAEQFTNYVKIMQQQAILESSTLGIRVTKDGYDVLRFQDPSTWQPMPAKSIFRHQHFPAHSLIHLKTREKNANPAIIIHASGDMTPFQLNFDSAKQTTLITVTGTSNGSIAVRAVPSP